MLNIFRKNAICEIQVTEGELVETHKRNKSKFEPKLLNYSVRR